MTQVMGVRQSVAWQVEHPSILRQAAAPWSNEEICLSDPVKTLLHGSADAVDACYAARIAMTEYGPGNLPLRLDRSPAAFA